MDTYIKNTDLKPSPPLLPWMMTTLKYNHSSTETARNCPTYIQNGALITLQRERGSTIKTHERHYLYTEDTVNSQKGWARDGFELRWLVGWNKSLKMTLQDKPQGQVMTFDLEYVVNVQRKCPSVDWLCPGVVLGLTFSWLWSSQRSSNLCW